MKRKNKIEPWFGAAGLLIISTTLMLGQRLKIPDLLYGALFGIGMGIIIVSMLRKKIKADC